MTFITNSNFKKIIYEIDIEDLFGEVYKDKIFFLNKNDIEHLLKAEKLLKDSNEGKITLYKKIDKDEDTRTLIFEGGTPAYHESVHCETLNSDYVNYVIPDEIREKGDLEVIKFRSWFKSNLYLLENGKEDLFKFKLLVSFKVKLESRIFRQNGGFTQIINKDISTIKSEIDSLIYESKKYFATASAQKKNLIQRFQKFTFIDGHNYSSFANSINCTEEELKSFLIDHNSKFKNPVKKLLIEYYRQLHNPKLEFKPTFLEALGLKPCSKCINL